MKKVILLSLLAYSLAGCGSKSENADAKTDEQTQSVASAENANEQLTSSKEEVYLGVVQDKDIEFHVVNKTDQKVEGYYVETATNEKVVFVGAKQSDGVGYKMETSIGEQKTGFINATFTADQRIEGEWRSFDGNIILPIIFFNPVRFDVNQRREQTVVYVKNHPGKGKGLAHAPGQHKDEGRKEHHDNGNHKSEFKNKFNDVKVKIKEKGKGNNGNGNGNEGKGKK